MGKKEVFGQKFVCAVLFLWSGACVLLNSTIRYFWGIKIDNVNHYVDYSVLILLTISILFFQKYTIRDFAVIVIGTVLIGVTAIFASHYTLVAAWIYIVATKHADYDKIVKVIYFAQLIAFLIVIYLFFFEYIDENVLYRGTMIRHSLGFSHPNQLGITVFFLGVYRLYGRKDRLNFGDMLILLLLAIFVRFVPNSKTAYYSLFILWVITFIHLLMERMKLSFDGFSKWCIFFTVFVNIGSVFLSTRNIKNNAMLSRIDTFMSARFSQCYRTYHYYGIKWLGQDVQLFVQKIALGKYYHFWLDNAYMALLLRYGIILYIVFSSIYVWAMIYQKNKKNYLLVEIMFVYAIYGIMENNFFAISQNIFLLMLGCPLFQEVNNTDSDRIHGNFQVSGKHNITG